MTRLIKRETNNNLATIVLLDNDGKFIVSVDKERSHDSYDRIFDFLFEAFDFFDWAIENE